MDVVRFTTQRYVFDDFVCRFVVCGLFTIIRRCSSTFVLCGHGVCWSSLLRREMSLASMTAPFFSRRNRATRLKIETRRSLSLSLSLSVCLSVCVSLSVCVCLCVCVCLSISREYYCNRVLFLGRGGGKCSPLFQIFRFSFQKNSFFSRSSERERGLTHFTKILLSFMQR